ASRSTSINHTAAITFRVDCTLMPRDSRSAIALARFTNVRLGGGCRAASRAGEGTGKQKDEPSRHSHGRSPPDYTHYGPWAAPHQQSCPQAAFDATASRADA